MKSVVGKPVIKAALGLAAATLMSVSAMAELTVGFVQTGSESGWRTAFTNATKAEAEARGYDFKFADAQGKQENQIKAIRSFIVQGVDGIVLAPLVTTGWDKVLKEADRAGIPVVLVDRGLDSDPSLYVTSVGSDFTMEGAMIGAWMAVETEGTCDIVELQGAVGADAAIKRQAGFANVIENFPGMQIIASQTGSWSSTGGKEVMESFLKSIGGENICAVWAHNDNMAIGAAQAIKEAGLQPSEDILIASVDAITDIFKTMADGETNVTLELSPYQGAAAFDALEAHLAGEDVPKRITVPGGLFYPETAAEEYARRK
ncbi:ABC transporter substrate-binding protein [Reinekea blandensis]|nr:ABC transporter substrate-binding protein [Reinekea blandensis]